MQSYFPLKAVGPLCLGLSRGISFAAQKTCGSTKWLLKNTSNFLELFSYTDMCMDLNAKTWSAKTTDNLSGVIGAALLTAGSAIDDYMGWSAEHGSRFTSALCVYNSLNMNDSINSDVSLKRLADKSPLGINPFAAAVSGLLLLYSYAANTASATKISNSKTEELLTFSRDIQKITGLSYDPSDALYTGTAVGTIAGAGRQMLSDVGAECGASLNGFVKAITSGGLVVAANLGLVDGLGERLNEIVTQNIMKLDQEALDKLRSNPDTARILNDLPNIVKTASQSLTKTTVNYSMQTGAKQLLTAQSGNTGFHTIVVTNLLGNSLHNTFEGLLSKMLKNDHKSSAFSHTANEADVKTLQAEWLKASASSSSAVQSAWDSIYTAGKVVGSTIFSGIIISWMNGKGLAKNLTDFKGDMKPAYAVATAALTEGQCVDTDGAHALRQIATLLEAIDSKAMEHNALFLDAGTCHHPLEGDHHMRLDHGL